MSLGLSFGLNGAGSAVAAAPTSTPTNLITNGDFTSTSPPPTLTASASSFMTVAGGTLNMVGGIGVATAWWDISGFEAGGSYYITGNMTARTTARAQLLVGGTIAATILATGVFSATVTAGSSDTRYTIKGTNAGNSSATWSIDDVAVYRALQTVTFSASGTGSAPIGEEVPVGTTVSTLDFTTTGSTLTLTNTAGGKFVLVGNTIKTAAALDYGTATSHGIEVTETLAGAYGSPKVTALTVTVTDYAPTLSFDWTPEFTRSTSLAGYEAGIGSVDSAQQAGTTVSLLDSAGGRFAVSVDGSYNVSIITAINYIPSGDYDVTVRVENPEATNSPYDVTHTITVT